jgi:hypothetical protein
MDTVTFPQSRCLAGIARADVTPPVGIYHRMWGAAMHDRSTGVHRPLTATVLLLADASGSPAADSYKAIVALDHCLLWKKEMDALLSSVSQISGVDRHSLVIFFSHTHGAGLMGLERTDLPGGDLIPAYLDQVSATVARLVARARSNAQPAAISYVLGHCSLAANRDYFDSVRNEFVCGYNPGGTTDDTLLVGRVTSSDGRAIASIVNYACHPTTLAWQNTLISPDYVGAMRDVIESVTSAPTVFIQGASGDLGPRVGYVGEVSAADQNGRQLAYAVLSCLESLPPPLTNFQYDGAVVSGATLGTWKHVPVSDEQLAKLATWRTRRRTVPLAYRTDLPSRHELEQEHRAARQAEADSAGDPLRQRDARAMVERATRRLTRVEHLPVGDRYPYAIHLWRIGDAVWVACDGEHYNFLQRGLRARFPGVPIIVGTLANGSTVWYLPDSRSYGKGLYQEEASILTKGSLEQLEEAIAEEIRHILDLEVHS